MANAELQYYTIKQPYHVLFLKLSKYFNDSQTNTYLILGSYAIKKPLPLFNEMEYVAMKDDVIDENINAQYVFQVRHSALDPKGSIQALLDLYGKYHLDNDNDKNEIKERPYRFFSKLVHSSLDYMLKNNMEYDELITTITK